MRAGQDAQAGSGGAGRIPSCLLRAHQQRGGHAVEVAVTRRGPGADSSSCAALSRRPSRSARRARQCVEACIRLSDARPQLDPQRLGERQRQRLCGLVGQAILVDTGGGAEQKLEPALAQTDGAVEAFVDGVRNER